MDVINLVGETSKGGGDLLKRGRGKRVKGGESGKERGDIHKMTVVVE